MEQSELLQHVGHVALEPNPALLEHAQKRAESVQNRIADQITAFAGSMWFVYIHIIWFSCWIGFGVEKYPYGLLTMIVSLEAIFLSTFVMISQNRADAKRQVIANQQWQTVKGEDKQNEELLDLSNQILQLTKAIHSFTNPRPDKTEKSGSLKRAHPWETLSCPSRQCDSNGGRSWVTSGRSMAGRRVVL